MGFEGAGNEFWTKVSAEIEALVVSGRHDTGRALLDGIPPRSIPREFAVPMAQMASRIHHSIYALKVLHRFVLPDNTLSETPTDSEKIIYGYALSNLGAVDEALEIFDSVSSDAEPEVLIQKAMANFARWNYNEAVPLLEQFIGCSGVSEYRRTVGQVNLAAAFVCIKEYATALTLLQTLTAFCKTQGFQLLHGNCLELTAQVHFFQKGYSQAIALLEESHAQLKDQNGIYLFVVKKWLTLCHAFQTPGPETLLELRQLREQAVLQCHWETARELDLFEAVLCKDESLLRKVMMGTPSAGYRQRIRFLYETRVRPQGSYEFLVGNASLAAEPVLAALPVVFDPYERHPDGSALYDKPQMLSLFEALSLDFYKPAYIGALFKQVYPQEKFNPYTSPSRVMQLLKRLDQWFTDHNLPLRVQFKKSEFALCSAVPCRVRIHRGKRLSAEEAKWLEAKDALAGRHFSTARIGKLLGISKTSAQRLIKEGLAQGKLTSSGRGRAVTYAFKSSKLKQAG